MPIIGKEKYSLERIEKIYNYLKLYAAQGQGIEYEIFVDGFRTVRRTDNPDMFWKFKDLMITATKNIEILLYRGKSNNNDKFIFTFQKETDENGKEVKRLQEVVNKVMSEAHKNIEELKGEADRLKEKLAFFRERLNYINSVIEEVEAMLF